MKNLFLPRFSFGNCLLLLLLVFFSALDTKAQANVWWFEPWNGQFPHAFAPCPTCSSDAAYGSPSQTYIEYAINGYNGITPIRDMNLFVTLTGGRLMGGMYEDSTCEFNTTGYGTIGYSSQSGDISCANAANTITATFNQPVFGYIVELQGKYPQTLIVTESGRPPINVVFAPVYRQGQLVGGSGRAFLSGKKISGLTVKSTDPNFAFSVGYIRFFKTGGSFSNNPPPNYCPVETQARPAPENISRFGWTMHSEIIRCRGSCFDERSAKWAAHGGTDKHSVLQNRN